VSLLELIGLIASVIAIVEFAFKAPALIKKLAGTFCRFFVELFRRKTRPPIPSTDEFFQGSYRKGTILAVPGNHDIDVALLKKI